MSSDRGPLDTAKAFAWTVFLVVLLLWLAVWLIQQIWVWLLVLLAAGLLLTAVVWWVRVRRDRW